jgi:hypothetical protein
MSLKRMVLERGMKLMSNPRVMKVLSNPRVMTLVMKGFQLRAKAQAEMDAQIKALARRFKLATREDVSELKRTLRALEEQLRRVESERDGNAKAAQA